MPTYLSALPSKSVSAWTFRSSTCSRPFLDSIRLAFDEAFAGGVIDRPGQDLVKDRRGAAAR